MPRTFDRGGGHTIGFRPRTQKLERSALYVFIIDSGSERVRRQYKTNTNGNSMKSTLIFSVVLFLHQEKMNLKH